MKSCFNCKYFVEEYQQENWYELRCCGKRIGTSSRKSKQELLELDENNVERRTIEYFEDAANYCDKYDSKKTKKDLVLTKLLYDVQIDMIQKSSIKTGRIKVYNNVLKHLESLL